jgi:hypothetical protein
LTLTLQILQDPAGLIPSRWHKEGMKTPFALAASISDWPGSAKHSFPSISNFNFPEVFIATLLYPLMD